MWASSSAVGSYGAWPQSHAHASAAVPHGQWPPFALNGMGWWADAYGGWHQQPHCKISATKKASTKYPKLKNIPTSAVGLSFSALEQRLSQSWEELVNKEGQHICEAQSTNDVLTAVRSVSTAPKSEQKALCLDSAVAGVSSATTAPKCDRKAESSSIDASRSSLFCPLCAEEGYSCPFHTANCWASACRERRTSQQIVCEEPPPSHIAHAMIDHVLDMEDASTEAGSSEGFSASGSRSDDLSDTSDANDARSPSPVEDDDQVWPELHRRGGHNGAANTVRVKLPDPFALKQLLSMGFPEADARSALSHHRGLDAAVSYLLGEATAQ